MNGAFRFFSDQPFDSADPYSYPERLEIRVPGKGEWLSRTHSLGLYVQDKWQMTTSFTLNVGLRYDLHVSPLYGGTGNPLFDDPSAYPIDKNNLAPRVGLRLQHRQSVSAPRRLRAVLREAVRRPVQHLPAEPCLHHLLSGVVPRRERRSRSEPGRFPTDPLLVNGPVLNRASDRSARSAGIAGPEHGRRSGWTTRIASFHTRTRFARLRADAGRASSRCRPITRTCRTGCCRSAFNLNPGIKPNTGRTTPVVRTDLLGLAERTRAVAVPQQRLHPAEYRRDRIRRPLRAAREAVLELLGRPRRLHDRLLAEETPMAVPRRSTTSRCSAT